jgi:hypothetical protein
MVALSKIVVRRKAQRRKRELVKWMKRKKNPRRKKRERMGQNWQKIRMNRPTRLKKSRLVTGGWATDGRADAERARGRWAGRGRSRA